MDCYIINLSNNSRLNIPGLTTDYWREIPAPPSYSIPDLPAPQLNYASSSPDSLRVTLVLGSTNTKIPNISQEGAIAQLKSLLVPEQTTGEPPNVSFICGNFRFGAAKVERIGEIEVSKIGSDGSRLQATVTIELRKKYT